MKIRNFKIEGNHPIGKYIDWVAIGLDQLCDMVEELADAGYEIKITPIGRYKMLEDGAGRIRKIFMDEKFHYPTRKPTK